MMNKLSMSLKTVLASVAISFAGMAVSTVAYAGPYADRLGRCLVENTTQQDRIVLVQWIFSAMAAHPSLEGMSDISTNQLDDLDRHTGALFTRLMTQDCLTELRNALNNEGEAAIQSGAEVLGQVAFADLMRAPGVARRLGAMDRYVDQQALERAFDGIAR